MEDAEEEEANGDFGEGDQGFIDEDEGEEVLLGLNWVRDVVMLKTGGRWTLYAMVILSCGCMSQMFIPKP